MTQEDKELLLKDLCARLLYAPKGVYSLRCDSMHSITFDNLTTSILDRFTTEQPSYTDEIVDIKPYLRPMSSMTEEEARTIFELYGYNPKDILQIKITDEYLEAEIDDGWCSFERYVIWYDEIVNSIQILDFLVSNHFDYRGLIEKGLALPAPEGMYE